MMRRRVALTVFLVLIGVAVSSRERTASAGERAEPAAVTFERDVRPIFKEACFHCHGEEEEHAGGLDLRLRRFVVQGGDSGAAIVPGNAKESYLIQRLRDGEMPPPDKGKPLSPEQIAVITRWVEAGASTIRPEPETIGPGLMITEEDRQFWAFQPIQDPPVPDVQNAVAEFARIRADAGNHPNSGEFGYEGVRAAELVRNPVDAFVLKRLEAAGLSFSPEADKRTLIRRASFDLIGLPPTPAEVDDFIVDESPDAYERLIDRLLDSPHYGERWGRHWLDVAGYTDSEGMTDDDIERKWAWKYRDYVIAAFNKDKPFDEFVREQLAGDELVGPPFTELAPEAIEKLTATGFLRMAPDGTASGGLDAGVARNQVIADTVEILSTAFLGLTVNCAQCHEHRYDPIPQADYYRLRAIFEPALDWKNWRPPPQRLISLYTAADREQSAALEAEAKEVEAQRLARQEELINAVLERELAKIEEPERTAVAEARSTPPKTRTKEQQQLLKKYPSVNVSAGSLYLYDKTAADELKKMADQAAEIRARKPLEEFLRVLTEVPNNRQLPQSFLFARGDHEQPKEAVQPAGLTILGGDLAENAIPVDDPQLPTTGRRLAFANRLTTGKHPLLTRVIVNRVWLHHFGRGIVETPGDFGHLGAEPTHPELLDWLATEFVKQGWSLKRLHRLMMTSTTYRQQLRTDPKHDELDPDNRLYGGSRLKRLDAEALRDSLLAISGTLNRKPGGPPIPVMADLVGQWVIGIENLNAGRPGAVIPLNGEEFRRSVYVQVRRSRPLAVLDTFDRPTMEPNCECRNFSTAPTQSLMLMNGEFLLEQAEHFARRLQAGAGDNPQAQIELAWRTVFSRPPTEAESADALTYLKQQADDLAARLGEKNAKQDPRLLALASLCQVLFGSNEFLYVD